MLDHITGHRSSIEMKPIASIMKARWAGSIRKDLGNDDRQKARPTPGSAQGSGALVLEEPSYSSWDPALERRAAGSHSLRCIHGHWTMTFRSFSLRVDPDSSVKAIPLIRPVSMTNACGFELFALTLKDGLTVTQEQCRCRCEADVLSAHRPGVLSPAGTWHSHLEKALMPK